MIWRKITIFVVLLSIYANIILYVHAYADMRVNWQPTEESCLLDNADILEPVNVIRMQAPILQYLFFETYEGKVHEVNPDIPENFECIIVKPKNRVQEARRIVDEYLNSNICSI